MAKLNIINKAEKVVGYVFVATNKSPKKLRCDIVPLLRTTSTEILGSIIEANCYRNDDEDQNKKRKELKFKSIVRIRQLEAYAEICKDMNYLTKKQFNYLTTLTYELYETLTKWN